MIGAWIGDIAGSDVRDRFDETEAFSLFMDGSHLTDTGIMVAVVARAIMKSREEQFNHAKNGMPFYDFLIQETQTLGGANIRRTGSAAYATPCGETAVSLKEAAYMARICAETAGEDLKAVKEAEAVAGIIFLAKMAKSKEEICDFLIRNYFDPETDRGFAGIAVSCFLKSTDFESTVCNAVKMGGSHGSLVASIAGAIAWQYYCARNWNEKPDEKMQQISAQAERFIPREFRTIETEFRQMTIQRAGTYYRTGFCTSIMSQTEEITYFRREMDEAGRGERIGLENITMPSDDGGFMSPEQYEIAKKRLEESLKRKKAQETKSCVVTIRDAKDLLTAYEKHYTIDELFQFNLSSGKTRVIFELKRIAENTQPMKMNGKHTFQEIRQHLGEAQESNADGKVTIREMRPGRIRLAFETKIPATDPCDTSYKTHTIEEARRLSDSVSQGSGIGTKDVCFSKSLHKTRMLIQLDQDRYWFLSIFFDDNNGRLEKYSLDYEGASDSHYEFRDETSIRKLFHQDGDEELYLEEIFLRFMEDKSGWCLIDTIKPYITSQFHYD